VDVLRGLRRILSPAERRQVRGVLWLAVLTGVVQTMSVFSVMPFVAVVSDPGRAMGTEPARIAMSLLGLETARGLVLAAAAGVLCLVLLANALGAVSLRRIQLTAWNINHYLTRRLLATYLARPYPWFLDRHSSGLTRNLLSEVGTAVQGGLMPLMRAAVRGAAGALTVVLLLVVDPLLTLGAGAAMGVAYLLTYWSMRALQQHLGEERIETTGMRYRVTTEALGGVKEIKALGAEEEFIRRFEETGPRWVRAKAWTNVLAELPSYVLEVLSLGTVLVVFLVLVLSGRALGEMLPTLVLFGFAGYKLVPSFHQVFLGASRAVNALPAIRTIEAELDEPGGSGWEGDDGTDRIRVDEDLELDGVSFTYSGAADPALRRICTRIRRGERVGVVGPTGAGKTTLVDILLGLLLPDEGAIRIDGEEVDMARDGRRWRAGVGYVPQSIFLSDDTIARNIAFGVPEEDVDAERVRRVAREAELDPLLRRLPEGLETTVGERGVRISGGQMQRIGIARALYRNPELLLLDEATSALDRGTERSVMDSIYGLEDDRTLVIVAHRLSTVEPCDRILLLDGGRLVAEGTYDQLMEESELFRVMARGVEIGAAAPGSGPAS